MTIEYVLVMHDGSRATKFMSEDYCKDLMEQLAAAQSTEVCTVAHSAKVMAFCPYCKIEALTAKLREIAETCEFCGGTGEVSGGLDPTGRHAMFPCDACLDVRALL